MHRSNRTHRLFLSAALLLGAVAVPRVAAAVPTTNWLDYTLIAKDRMHFGGSLNLSGNFAVTNPGGMLELSRDDFQLDGVPTPFMAADTISMTTLVSIVDAYTNQIIGLPKGEVRGQIFGQSFPLALDLPTFPTSEVCDPCVESASDVGAPIRETITLTPGCYGNLIARRNSVVMLEPGSYNFKRWEIRGFASVIALGPVQIHIRERLRTEGYAFLGAASANVMDYQVWIGATKSCVPTSDPSSSAIGKFGLVIGTFVAPEDRNLDFGKDTMLIGTAMAEQVFVRGTHSTRPPTPTPTPQVTPTPNGPTPTPQVTPTPNGPTPTPNFPTPTPTPNVKPTRSAPTPTPNFATPTPTQPFTPPTPTATVVPRKHPWGKKSGLIESLFPARTGSRVAPSMRRPMSVRR